MTDQPDGSAPTSEEAIRAATVGTPQPLQGRISIDPYDPVWPAVYEEEAARIREVLPHAVELHHAGSTSVPGLAAKPLLDLVLVVPDPADEDSYAVPLAALDYVLAIREPDWYEHRVLKKSGLSTALPQANLHVFPPDCAETARMLRFRDHLRAHPADRELYQRTKLRLASQDWKFMQNYADAKSEVVAEITERAEARSGRDAQPQT
ncbi:GrpB family protein [Streptomyces sp. NPDC004111]|uniref:GrpB family protein n=1 Tax=Streptomyces sp. NPDC004111 TaxID=3364690 RepID=UPI0036974019